MWFESPGVQQDILVKENVVLYFARMCLKNPNGKCDAMVDSSPLSMLRPYRLPSGTPSSNTREGPWIHAWGQVCVALLPCVWQWAWAVPHVYTGRGSNEYRVGAQTIQRRGECCHTQGRTTQHNTYICRHRLGHIHQHGLGHRHTHTHARTQIHTHTPIKKKEPWSPASMRQMWAKLSRM